MEHCVLTGAHPTLVAGILDLWHARTPSRGDELRHLADVLSRAEHERAARFLRDVDRNSFVAARGLLRVLLGRYLKRDPAHLEIGATPAGKPRIDGPIEFNLSHSEDRIVLGFACERAVGVDIQRIVPGFPWRDHLDDVFSPEERAALTPGKEHAEFFRCWVRKEALTKAQGLGLVRAFPSFSIAAERSHAMGDINVGEHFAGSWAIEGPVSPRVRKQAIDISAL